VVVGFGSALSGAALAFVGVLYIEHRKRKARCRGIVTILESDLRANVVKMRGMQDRVQLPIHQRPVDLLGPPSSELWKALRVEIAGFLSLEMVFKLNLVYEELDVYKASLDIHPLLIDVTTAPQLIEQWVRAAEALQDQLLNLKGLETPMSVRAKSIEFIRERTEEKQAVVAARTARMDAVNDVMNGQKEQTQ
jgi:hypothetical protein